jgi:Ca-activated chloride channel family protein
VSLGEPAVLAALVAVPVLVGWYVRRERRRAAGEAAFAAPLLVASYAPRRPGFRRHAPLILLAAALVALIVAAAKPQRTVAVPVERASIFLATDVSGSMLAKDVQPNRLTAARKAAQSFADDVPRSVQLGVLAFNQNPTILQQPTRDRAAVSEALDRLASSGGTATGEAVLAALRVLRSLPGDDQGRRAPSAIVLISDGASTKGADPVEAARQAGKDGIRVYTVALGTPQGTITVKKADGSTETRKVPPDPTALRQMAAASGGRSFSAADASGLAAVYDQLASQLGRERRNQEISSAFAGGALLLLLAGSGLSLRWFGRIV